MFVCRLAGGLAIAAMLALGTSSAYAEPTSDWVTISELRPYIGGDGVFVYQSGMQGPCGQQVGANAIYTIDLSSSAGKAAYATALAALTASKKVKMEAIAGKCGTAYPGLQSIYIGG